MSFKFGIEMEASRFSSLKLEVILIRPVLNFFCALCKEKQKEVTKNLQRERIIALGLIVVFF